MKESRFLYKCRLCGKIDDSLCTGEKNAMPRLIEAAAFGKSIGEGSINDSKNIPSVDENLIKEHIK